MLIVVTVLLPSDVGDGGDDAAPAVRPRVDPRIALERRRDRAHPADARAKARVRAVLDRIEACAGRIGDYGSCLEGGSREVASGRYGRRPGQVKVIAFTADSLTVRARSRERTGRRFHTFVATRDASGREIRTCTAGPENNAGACIRGEWSFARPVRPADSAAAQRKARSDSQTEGATAKAIALAVAAQTCFERTHDYVLCQSAADLGVPEGDVGTAAGQAHVAEATPEQLTIVSYSKTGTLFQLRQTQAGAQTRTCEPGGAAGCRPDGHW